jgi:helix-turn-helix protein/integrase-like protein
LAISVEQKRELVEAGHPRLSLRRQCALLGLARGSWYYQPVGPSAEDVALMRVLDEQYTATPFYGIRRMTAWLRSRGYAVNHKRVGRLLRQMGLEAIYPKPRLSQPAVGHVIYPYLLRGITVNRVNQVWSADITYVRLAGGFVYLVAVIDWCSRYVLSWAVSITMDGAFCVEAFRRSGMASRKSSILIREPSSRVWPLPSGSNTAAFGSAWMAAGGPWTTCLWSACGGVSNGRRSICEITKACGTRARAWHNILAFTTGNGSIKPWAIGRPRPCTWPKGRAVFILGTWLRREQATARSLPQTYFATKMV